MKNFWLVKSEPDSYSWDDLVRDGETSWTGVRNYTARNHLRAMRLGDEVLYYHSNVGKAVVGRARVSRIAYADPTAKEGDWSAVDLQPLGPLRVSVHLEMVKQTPALQQMALVRLSRLSVQPVTAAEFRAVLRLGK